jgi:hypothetical protein
MLTYRRKAKSGKMHMMDRKGGARQRRASLKTLRPGDELTVNRVEELPGYPYSMDGWELVGEEAEPINEEQQVTTRRTRTRS